MWSGGAGLTRWAPTVHLSTLFPSPLLFRSQRQRLIHRSGKQQDGGAGPATASGNNLKSPGGLENGGRGSGEQEQGDKTGQQGQDDNDEDGIFSPVRIPSERFIFSNRDVKLYSFTLTVDTVIHLP